MLKNGGLLQGFNLPAYDHITLGYTGTDLSLVTFKNGGVSGATVAVLELTYLAGVLQTVTKVFG